MTTSAADGVDQLLDLRGDRLAAAREQRGDEDRRAYLRSLVEPFPIRRAVLHGRTEDVPLEGYRRERVVLEVFDGVRFSAYRLVPDGWVAPGPAVVVVHGHGYGSRELVGLDPAGEPLPAGSAELGPEPVAVRLARSGVTVWVPDVVGFGERRTDRDASYDDQASSSCYRLGTRLLMQGQTLSGLRVAELLGLVEHLATDPDVDAARIGTVGFSGGAMWAMISAALDDRIAATALCAYPNTFAASIESIRHCLCNYLPGQLAVGEQPDFAGLIAPRGLFCESGRADRIFPVAGFETAIAQLAPRWSQHPDAFGHDLHDGGHGIDGRRAVPWLLDRLGVTG